MRRLTDGTRLDRTPLMRCQSGGCRHTPSPISPTKTVKRKVYKQPDRYESHLDLSCDPEDIIGNRILSVVEYLRRIQEK
jgi:hypothetical protein